MRTLSLYELHIYQNVKRSFRNALIGMTCTFFIAVVFLCNIYWMVA